MDVDGCKRLLLQDQDAISSFCLLACRRSPRRRVRAQSSENNRKHGGVDCGNPGVCVAWCAIKRDIKSPIADPSRWLIVELIFPLLLLLLLQDGRSDTGFEAGRRSRRLQFGYVFFFLLLFPWKPVNRLRKEKRKRKMKERTQLGQLGFRIAGLEN